MDGRTPKDGSDFSSEAESVYKSIPAGDKPKKQKKKTRGPKKKRHWLRRLVIAVIALIVLGAGCSLLDGGGSSASHKELSWPTSGLATMLPTPDSTRGEVTSNTNDHLYVEVFDYDENKYRTYMEVCKDAGFTVDPHEESSSYRAYDVEGYQLQLSFYDFSDPKMVISLDDPVSNDPIAWPTAGLGAAIPAPTSLTGEITSDSSTYFKATITNTSPDDYKDYVASCMSAGFTVDYSRGDTSFQGSNSGGVELYINYVGFNTMTITAQQDSSSANTASAEEDTSAQENASTSANEGQDEAAAAATEQATTNTSGVTPSFKEAMDSYEAFFDKYVQFMQKYKDDGYPASMLADYSSMMQQYADFTQKIDAIDESTLSTADDAYYLTVTARIYQKLATVSS